MPPPGSVPFLTHLAEKVSVPALNNICVWPNASLTLNVCTLLAGKNADGGEPASRSELLAWVALVALVASVAFVALTALIAFVALAAVLALPARSAVGTVTPLTFNLALVTAPFFSCLVPTLFFGRLNAA